MKKTADLHKLTSSGQFLPLALIRQDKAQASHVCIFRIGLPERRQLQIRDSHLLVMLQSEDGQIVPMSTLPLNLITKVTLRKQSFMQQSSDSYGLDIISKVPFYESFRVTFGSLSETRAWLSRLRHVCPDAASHGVSSVSANWSPGPHRAVSHSLWIFR